MAEYYAEKLLVKFFDSRPEMGAAAAEDGAALLRHIIADKGTARIILAAAPSQNELLSGLCRSGGIPWEKVTAFHMDEYIGLSPDAPQGFGNFLRTHIFDKLPFGTVHYLNGCASDIGAECSRYSALLKEAPIDICFLGIGENGHIAFNDPHVANFCDDFSVKVVKLDDTCRMQQVHDGCFDCLADVPQFALTLTVPILMGAQYKLCVVPSLSKAEAVYNTLFAKVSEACPATAMRVSENSILFLDSGSASMVLDKACDLCT